jgi:hypothetical protein
LVFMVIDLSKLDDKAFSDFAETHFEAEAKRRGLHAYRTSGENKEHDIVVENPAAGQIYKVQIKASRTPRKGTRNTFDIYLRCGGFSRLGEGKMRRRGYSPEGVDVMVIVLPLVGEIYLIPNRCKPPTQICLEPGSNRKYEGYRDLWNVFCVPLDQGFVHNILGGTCPGTCGRNPSCLG